MRVREVAEARRQCQPLISWGAILVKAIALTAQRQPELRQAFMRFPWPHIYEHPHCVATYVVEREWRGEIGTFFGKIKWPEKRSLRDIDARLRKFKTNDIESVFHFRRLIQITRLPLPLRRLIWRLVYSFSGRLKMHQMGTFSLNSIGARGVAGTQSMAVVAMSWFYGPVNADGMMPIQVFFDHRVIDAMTVNRIVYEVAKTLKTEIVDELHAGG